MDREIKIKASLLQPREGAGKYWWETFIRGHISDINRRFNQARALHVTNSEAIPRDLFSYVREAALCFEIGRYLPTIHLASLAAKLILERDARCRTHGLLVRQARGEIALGSRNLLIAEQLGLPVHALLSENETLGDTVPIIFVLRSDAAARGDVSNWFHEISEYVPRIEHEAFDQLDKAQRFLVEWFNTSPDIQSSRELSGI